MRVSLNIIKQYIDFDLPETDELVDRINRQLGGVEGIVDLKAQYSDAVIVKVISAERHPDADKLSVCFVDDKGATLDVPRDEQGLVQVVCGAPNVSSGMYAVWLPPKSTVPSSFADNEPFVLSARELRGVLSQGMLAAADELAIGSDHEGIVELTQSSLSPRESRAIEDLVGLSFADVFGLDGTVIEIENKMFTHRPDLFGQIGVAREVAGIYHRQFASPTWYRDIPSFADARSGSLELSVFNEAQDKVPRFMTVSMGSVKVEQSPLWLQCELVGLGGKPINNIVDITNYVMLLTGQPVHAYDYSKIRGRTIGARLAHKGETVALLNGKTYELSTDDIVIADAEGPIGLAGVMGGGGTEVDGTTHEIVLEVANFDMYTVRRSAMRHGVFTDALTRFNKGQSPLQNDRILALLIKMVSSVAQGEQAGSVVDNRNSEVDLMYDRQSVFDSRSVAVEFINTRLGVSLSANEMAELLSSTEIDASVDGGILHVTAPYWRTDISLAEDVVEEVGRLYGYDRLPQELPKRTTKPAEINTYRELTESIRQALARAGANEVLTYSFVHKDIIEKAGQDTNDAYTLSNALSPDLQYYRLSIAPSLLDKVHSNIRAGFDEFALFEIGKSHSKKAGMDDEGLPVEPKRIALTYASKTPREGAAFYRVKRLLEFLSKKLGLQLNYKELPHGSTLAAAAPYADGRTARVIDRKSGQAIGIIGEYTQSVKKGFKLPDYSAGFELFTEGMLLATKSVESRYRPLSKYPSIERDICFEVPEVVTYGVLVEEVALGLAGVEIESNIEPVDIYHAEGKLKRITVRIRLTPHENTMTNEYANGVVDRVANDVATKIGATII